jgi:hypothetical protein
VKRQTFCLVSKKKFSLETEAKDLSLFVNIKEEFSTRNWKTSNKEAKKRAKKWICDEDRREREREREDTPQNTCTFLDVW